MDAKQLRRLSRGDLLKILLAQIEENERLQIELDKANEIIKKRNIMLENAGTMADAALAINNVFEACDKAAKEYFDNAKMLTDSKCKDILSNANTEAQKIIDQALALMDTVGRLK